MLSNTLTDATPDSPKAPAPGHEVNGGAGVASVPLLITKGQRQQLYDLGYTESQVDAMKPADAHAILGVAAIPKTSNGSAPPCHDTEATSAMLAQTKLSHIPIKLGGGKEAALPTWEPFQSRLPTDEERAGWFGISQD